MKNKIIDMGAGLERFSWITMGTPTSYDCSFGSVIKYLENSIGIQKDESFLSNYFKFVSRKFNMIEDDSSDKIIKLKKSIAHEMGVTFEHLQKIVSPY
jgi:alanyl-tRNA synthetase